mgnify:CR=1 FL=1
MNLDQNLDFSVGNVDSCTERIHLFVDLGLELQISLELSGSKVGLIHQWHEVVELLLDETVFLLLSFATFLLILHLLLAMELFLS